MARALPAQACLSNMRISKATVKAMFEVGTRTRTWLDSLNADQWEIQSFDPESRVVCFNVTSNVSLHHMALTLPDMSSQSWSS